jgi:pimeloyl-ACP methyl ester carboxylesterase
MENFEHDEYFTTSDGTKLCFQRNWSSDEELNFPLLLFNYGLVCNNEHWKYQVSYFHEQGFPILIHDYRGHFKSEGEDNIEGITFERIACDIDELLEHLGIDEVVLFGHSMGVNVSLQYTLQFPQKVLGNIFISGTVMPPQKVMFDSSIINFVEPYVHWIAENFPTPYGALLESGHKNPLAVKIVRDGGFNTDKVSEEFVAYYLKKIGELPQEIFLHLMTQMKQHQLFDSLDEIQKPALVMVGDKDKVIPNHFQSVLHSSLPNSELYVIKDGSHVPQVDFPDTLNERVLYFLQQKLNFEFEIV